jgi:hypothetical protein
LQYFDPASNSFPHSGQNFNEITGLANLVKAITTSEADLVARFHFASPS